MNTVMLHKVIKTMPQLKLKVWAHFLAKLKFNNYNTCLGYTEQIGDSKKNC